MVLIFDYDGTCHDSIVLYGRAVRKAAEWLLTQGYTPARDTDDATLRRYQGMKKADMWADFLPNAPADITAYAAEMVGLELADGVGRGEARLFAGMEELLQKLKEKGHTLLILSNCGKRYKQSHWDAFGLERYFSKFYASENYGGIPKEEIFRTIREEYPGKWCMIGDRMVDMKVGDVHGIPTVACHYGYGTAEELQHATYHVYSVAELEQLLLSWEV